MISYELAKELKDAGFSQQATPQIARKLCVEHGQLSPKAYCKACGFVFIPDLDELIEACGNEFGTLSSVMDAEMYKSPSRRKRIIRWVSNPWPDSISDFDGRIEAMAAFPTREEAVARLWLALNKQK